MKKICLFLACVFFLSTLFSCSTPWQNKVTGGYLTGASLVTTAETTVKPSCDQSALSADKCAQLQDLYKKIRQGCVAAGNTLILALVTADAVQQNTLLTQYNTIMADTQTAMASYVQLYNQFQAESQGKLKFAMSPELLAIVINAFIALVQNIPAIIAAINSFSLHSVDVNALVGQIQAAQNSLPVW